MEEIKAMFIIHRLILLFRVIDWSEVVDPRRGFNLVWFALNFMACDFIFCKNAELAPAVSQIFSEFFDFPWESPFPQTFSRLLLNFP